MSSIYHISETTPPISIIHGDADPIVPLFQSQSFLKIAKAKGVPVELQIKAGAKHGWPNKETDEVQFLNWFNHHLLEKETVFESKVGARFRVGTCDWSLKLPLTTDSFHFAQRIGLKGIQYSFDAEGKGLDLRLRKNRDTIRETVRKSDVAISSMGIGLLNKIPLATTEEGERLVVECIDTMAKLKEEAATLEDRDLAAKVSPEIVLLAFFSKGDINGQPDLIESVITKLKRLAPLAEKHGFTLALESLLSEPDLRYILESVGSPAVKVHYDTGNSAKIGYDIYREIESLGTENICEIHLKENNDLISKGAIDFEKVKSLLVGMNYQGWLIIEGSSPKGMSLEESCEQNAATIKKLFNE